MYAITMEGDLIYRGLSVLLLTTITVLLVVDGQDIPVFFFSKNPQNKDVVEGAETRLQCDVSDRTNIRFHWTLNGKNLANSSRRFQEDSYLRILRVLRGEDEGAFRCIATNVPSAYSIVSQEAALNIQWIDDTAEVQLRRPKTKAELKNGSEMLLRCQVTGNPEPSYLWYHNKFRVFANDQIKVIEEGSRLRITGISAAKNGIYSCRAENVAGARDSSKNLLLNLEAPGTPHLLEDRFEEETLVQRGGTAILDCPFVNATRVVWYSNYEKLANNTRHLIYNNGSLFFPRVRPADEGSYRCEAFSRLGTTQNQAFSVDLALSNLEEFGWNSFEPRLRPNFPVVIPVNEKFQIKCFKPKGKPEPTLQWLDRNSIPVGTSGKIFSQENNLVFESAEQIDSGNYTCIARNMAGEKRKSVWVIVSVPPIVTKSPQPKSVEEEQTVKFQCEFTGTRYPVTVITWTKDSNIINPLEYPRHRMDPASGLLEVFNTQLVDAGNYACMVNTTGHPTVMSSSAFLTIKRKLKFRPKLSTHQFLELDSPSTIQCQVEAEDKPTIRWARGKGKRGEGDLDNFPEHVSRVEGMLIFQRVQRSDGGLYTCFVFSVTQGAINTTINVTVVVKPVIQVNPTNMTVQEDQSFMLHCLAIGDPKPTVVWDRNSRGTALNTERFKLLPNGTLSIKKVLLEDKGKYGCTANNSGGIVRKEIFLDVASPSEYRHKQREKEAANKDSVSGGAGGVNGMGMMKTVIIAVCSAGAYLALVIGLTAFCSYRLLMQRRTRKALTGKGENGELAREQMELLHKDHDRESTTQVKSDSENRSHISGMSSQPSHSSQSQSRSRRGSYDRLQFPRHDLHTIGMLGKGIYGNVFLAKAQGIKDGEAETLVVVKSLLTKDEHIFFEFRQEMDMYSRLENPNIVKLLGVCREAEPQFMMTEYCDWGDLKQFLLATRQDNGKSMARVPPLTTQQKLTICKQVALGMEHLSNYRFIHKDMAARNVLLTSRLDVKVSSLSLCQDIYAAEYYLYHQAMIPLRWMPPEAVLEDDYSTKSDVWSYGVFIWEVFHSGDLPHKSRTDEEVLKGMRAGDVTLEIGEHCPEEVTDLIRKCTTENPRERPMFGEVCIILSDIMMDNCNIVNNV